MTWLRTLISLRGDAGAQGRALKYLLVGLCASAGVLLYLLASAAANTALFANNYPVLLWLNAAMAALLLVIVLVLLGRLWQRHRAQVFGTRLTVRLVVIFALMAIVPGTLVYVVSVRFLGKSIESWFNVRVDKSLESGLTLAQATLDNLQNELHTRASSHSICRTRRIVSAAISWRAWSSSSACQRLR